MRFISFLFIFTINSLCAHELQVKQMRYSYQLSFDDKVISFQSADGKISFDKRECNRILMDQFSSLMTELMKKPLSPFKDEHSIEITFDGKTGYDLELSKRSMMFSTMYEHLKKMKIEESLNCAKK